MSDKFKELERDSLYKAVWKKPMSKLAPSYGISDVMLKKICRILNIPTPPRGYWAKIQNNIKVKKQPLPKLKMGQPSSYTIQKDEFSNSAPTQAEEEFSAEANQFIEKVITGKPLSVSKRLASPHRLVAQTRKVLADSEIDQYGMLIGDWKKPTLPLRVSPQMLSRALRLADAIVKFFEKEEVELITEVGDSGRSAHILLFDQKIPFFIREPSNRFDHELTSGEKKKLEKWSHAYHPNYDYHPSGKLVLEIDGYWSSGIRKRWADGKKNRVENFVKDFICNVIKIADLKRTRKIENEKREQQWELERQRRAELERQQEIELQRRNDLEKQSENWVKSRQLREYIQEVETAASTKGFSTTTNERYAFWLRWANNHADRLDPLINGLPFEEDEE